MNIFRNLSELPSDFGPVVATIGNFDGVHRGHSGVIAEVIHAKDMVGVGVGEEDGVDVGDLFADGLGVEVGAGVDEYGVVSPRYVYRGAGAAVARVACRGPGDGRGTDGAPAAERGDAHRGAGAEEGEGGVHAG